jgi:hypothetical protein
MIIAISNHWDPTSPHRRIIWREDEWSSWKLGSPFAPDVELAALLVAFVRSCLTERPEERIICETSVSEFVTFPEEWNIVVTTPIPTPEEEFQRGA